MVLRRTGRLRGELEGSFKHFCLAIIRPKINNFHPSVPLVVARLVHFSFCGAAFQGQQQSPTDVAWLRNEKLCVLVVLCHSCNEHHRLRPLRLLGQQQLVQSLARFFHLNFVYQFCYVCGFDFLFPFFSICFASPNSDNYFKAECDGIGVL